MHRLFGFLVIFHIALVLLRLFGEVEALEDWWPSTAGQIVSNVMVLLGLAGAIYFAIDSMRREYKESRELPIALAIAGVFTFGLLTIPYYLIWGWRPLSVRFGSEFCERCLQKTEEFTDDLSLATVNFVNGGRLVGNSDECSECGSVVRTHCFFLFGIPLFSKGSFRVLVPERDAVLLRKHDFRRSHLLQVAIIPAIVIAFFVMAWER